MSATMSSREVTRTPPGRSDGQDLTFSRLPQNSCSLLMVPDSRRSFAWASARFWRLVSAALRARCEAAVFP
jgi:hypothetical protein